MPIDENTAPLTVRNKGQMSYNTLRVVAGRVLEECNRDLRWPYCMDTYKLMAKDSTIAPALTLMEMNIAKVNWNVKIPEGYEDELKEKAEFLRSVMNDMEHTWSDFIKRTATFNRFGFAPIEKVYRRREKSKGSKYDDGKVGIKKLPIIAQDSIYSWEYSADGRELKGLKQSGTMVTGTGNLRYDMSSQPVYIPRKKFILFRADPLKDNPEGTSPLNSVYTAWRFKTELEKFESIGVSQDLRGLKVMKIPARYMTDNATDEEKETYRLFQIQLANVHRGEQSGIIIPSEVDDGHPLFDFKLESVMGQTTYNVHEIIGRYRKEIITGLLCQSLILGQDGSGSFALSESLEGATWTVVAARLREIRDQLNHDLIPQLFELNGWDSSITPYFDFDDFKEVDVDVLSKAIQRIASIGGIVLNAEVVNSIHEKLDLPVPFDREDISIEEVRKFTTGLTSNAGEGMEVGTTGQGTSKISTKRDNSISNMEN